MSVFSDLAEIIGTPGAKAMCSIWGGQRFYVPKTPAADGPLVLLLGELLAARLAAHFGGDYLELPMPDIAGARRVEVLELRAQALTAREIADRVGLSARRVRQILFASDQDARVGSISP